MTYRERREARAERLRGWADKREERADSATATAASMADAIPFGQPILVGHYSEGRDRAYRARIISKMDHAVADTRKAAEMRERAENVERAAARAIYSDDPDAAEALRAKVDKLEAQRGRLKEYNASCRAAAKVDPESRHGDLSLLDEGQRGDYLNLLKVCAWQVGKHGEFPSYAATNLGSTINTTKKRLAALTGEVS